MSRKTPAIDITRMSTLLIRDIRPERLTLPKTMPMPFAPFAEEDKYDFKTIDPTKSEPLCYLKHRFKDLWIYVDNGKPKFKPLQRDWTGFATFKVPSLFWLDYLEFPSFVLYQENGSVEKARRYLVYSEAYYHDSKTGEPDRENPVIYMGWTSDPVKATRFSFESIQWGDGLTMNIPARTGWTDAKLKKEIYKISETDSNDRPLP